jgi:hypothetical protein
MLAKRKYRILYIVVIIHFSPLIRLGDLIEQQDNSATAPNIKIMKKEQKSNNNKSPLPSKYKENDLESQETNTEGNNIASNTKNNDLEKKSYQEREEQYAKARARIFGVEDSSNNNNNNNNNHTGLYSNTEPLDKNSNLNADETISRNMYHRNTIPPMYDYNTAMSYPLANQANLRGLHAQTFHPEFSEVTNSRG